MLSLSQVIALPIYLVNTFLNTENFFLSVYLVEVHLTM